MKFDFFSRKKFKCYECGIKAIPRKYTEDFYMFYIAREEELNPHLLMNEGETFVDVGASR
jgi:hypothetical protein